MRVYVLLLLLALVSNNAFALMHKDPLTFKHGETTFNGLVYWDDAFEGKRPGILVFPEIWGLNDYAKLRAEMLAESGYVAFAVDLYGDGRNTRKHSEALDWQKKLTGNVTDWRERSQLALKAFKQHESVNRKQMAAIGFGQGGASVVQLAISGAELAGFVSVHGALPDIDAKDAGMMSSTLLLLVGDADKSVAKASLNQFTQKLTGAGVDWEMDIYGNAMQSYSNPYADSYGIENMAFNMIAEQRTWRRVLTFFETLLEEKF